MHGAPRWRTVTVRRRRRREGDDDDVEDDDDDDWGASEGKDVLAALGPVFQIRV